MSAPTMEELSRILDHLRSRHVPIEQRMHWRRQVEEAYFEPDNRLLNRRRPAPDEPVHQITNPDEPEPQDDL